MNYAKLAPLLNLKLPPELALKGLKKLNPKIGKFIQKASLAGFTADQIFKFIQDKGPQSEPSDYMDPFEGSSRSMIEQSNKRVSNLKKGIAGAATLGGAALGGGLAAQIGAGLEPELLEAEQQQIGYDNREQLEYDPYDRRPNIPQEGEVLTTPPPPRGKYPPAMIRPEFTPDFLKYLRPLIVNGTINKDDNETIMGFFDYWQGTEGQRRGSPFVEFEKYRVNRSGRMQPQDMQGQQASTGQEKLMAILEKLAQLRGGR